MKVVDTLWVCVCCSASSAEQILWAVTDWAASTSAYEDTGETDFSYIAEQEFLLVKDHRHTRGM